MSQQTGNVNTKTFTSKTLAGLSPWATINNTYSGCDMTASISIPTEKGVLWYVIGTVQTITYSIAKNIMPVRCLGDINAKEYVEGPRTIAGSLIFTVFDRHWTEEIRKQLKSMGIYDTDHYVTDELPPFDITISFVNEYGFSSRLAIYGVRIANEGQTMSINDIYIENTYQYVAMDIDYMKELNDPRDNKSTNTDTKANSGNSDVRNKPIETIPPSSIYQLQKDNSTVVSIDDDFTYSNIVPKNYSDNNKYKTALNVQRSEYNNRIEEYKKKYPNNITQYTGFVQMIKGNYNKKISDGIAYFLKKK